ncbi:MAG: translation initiation factor [Phycisphaerales bacterium]|nr:translation initiation factor [Phycisphaerales bacterium]MCI0630867.1 translation initiation factor [Phycisphaerales bacterium]MCI0675256.1 translation initiation factor [Phycisphaerales bacterium]
MPGLFAGTSLERPVTCEVCQQPLDVCRCPRNREGRVVQPRQQTAAIRLEKRGKGKIVTLISGLDPVATSLPELLKKLKSSCGAGGAIADDAIQVQGDQREKVANQLRSMGYQVRVNVQR